MVKNQLIGFKCTWLTGWVWASERWWVGSWPASLSGIAFGGNQRVKLCSQGLVKGNAESLHGVFCLFIARFLMRLLTGGRGVILRRISGNVI